MGDQASNQMSSAALAQWDVPVTVAFIDQGQDWNTRQQIQYAAIKGLMKPDFLGLGDWTNQIGLYSKANPIHLSGPMAAVTALTPLNSKLETSLVDDPDLGLVGNFLLQVLGFADIVMSPEDILNSADLGDDLGT